MYYAVAEKLAANSLIELRLFQLSLSSIQNVAQQSRIKVDRYLQWRVKILKKQ